VININRMHWSQTLPILSIDFKKILSCIAM
jgi:hypothetical protein